MTARPFRPLTSDNDVAAFFSVLPTTIRSHPQCRRLPARLRAGVALGLVLALPLVACGPMVDRAPFSLRADSLAPGDLLGPFEGIVVDAETDRPISGAIVTGSWAFERGVGLVAPAGASEVATETGADGRYRLPKLVDLPSGASMRVRRFTLIIYQKGYIGWRSDRRFPTGTGRNDFSQRGNRARLEKWRDGLFHSQHLVFLGGGPAIKAASESEVQAAVFELDGRSGGVGARVAPSAETMSGSGANAVPLDATPLLDEDEVRATTGYAGEFDVGRLADLPRTEFYDSRHFKARGQTEKYDVGVRVWRLGENGAEAQYRKLLSQLPGAVVTDEVGDASLRAKQAELFGLAFLVRSRGVVVAITCGTAQCSEPAVLVRLAKLIEGSLSELEAPPTEPEPAPTDAANPAGSAPAPVAPAAPATPAPAASPGAVANPPASEPTP